MTANAVSPNAIDLVGNTLASNVVASSLTSVGTLGSLNVNGDVDFTGNDFTITNAQASVRQVSTTAGNPAFIELKANGVSANIGKEGTSGTDFMTGGTAGALQLVTATDKPIEFGVNGAKVVTIASTGATVAGTIAASNLSGTNTGDQTITLTGDVTGSGTGSFAATIAANSVTLAKMAQVATDSILGRATAATGDVEVLTALPFAFTGDVTRPADSNATTIENDAVTYAKMQNVSATDKLLGRSTAGAGNVEEIACTAGARTMIAKIAPWGVYNQSVAVQGAGFASDTYLVGSSIAIPNSSLQAGSRYHCVFNVTKTAAGTAAAIIRCRFGTAGTTADTALCTFTFTAGTAAADEGVFDGYFTFRTVGSGTSAVLQGLVQLKHRSNGGGIAAQSSEPEISTSAGFDSTVSSSIIGLSVNGGTSAAWTVQLVQAELINLA